MKKAIVIGLLLAGLSAAFAQQSEQYPMLWQGYQGTNSTMTFQNEDLGVRVSGTASGGVRNGGAGFVAQAGRGSDLGLGGKRRIKFTVSGIDTAAGDKFDQFKLFKLEVNGMPLVTASPGRANINDRTYVNALNGDFLFDISTAGTITKLELVFFDCTVKGVKIEMFVE